ncbi:hypothetical protein D3C76_93620 [compost metagenome]
MNQPVIPEGTNHHQDSEGIGRIQVNTIPLSDEVHVVYATYTYSGKVFVSYTTDKDPDIADFYNLAILNEDGTDFKVIFSDVIATKPKANGIRYMPFQDNTRLILGDYVLECMPNIDDCQSTQLVPVEYPSEISDDSRTTHRWSEIIVAPDNKHVSWTLLRSDVGAAAALGILHRTQESYVITSPQLISTTSFFTQDSEDPEYIIPNAIFGGEVKQFIRGGNALSVAGGGKRGTPDSVLQDLKSATLIPVTNTPGYNETTIFSPDERLGIVMSTRFSKQTDLAIFGLLPRPYGLHTTMGLTWAIYMYSIAGVRSFRPGNIGPVLIDIEQSMNVDNYQGLQLTTDEDWVYLSPMSWHPGGTRAMWLEMLRGSNGAKMRVQTVTLLDYSPQPAVPYESTTDNVPYGIKDLSLLNKNIERNFQGKIRGKHSGVILYSRSSSGHSGHTEADYINYSDDGVQFYNGFEKTVSNLFAETSYESKLQLTGQTSGEMNLRATFSAVAGSTPLKLLFDADADGNPKSYGYSTYNGVTLKIEDMLE